MLSLGAGVGESIAAAAAGLDDGPDEGEAVDNGGAEPGVNLAGNPARCTAAPSAQQREDYRSTLVSYLIPSLSSLPPASVLPVSSETQQQFCQILEAGSGLISEIIDDILERTSGNRVKGGDLLAFTVDVAAKSCSFLLPVAKNALEQYSPSGS